MDDLVAKARANSRAGPAHRAAFLWRRRHDDMSPREAPVYAEQDDQTARDEQKLTRRSLARKAMDQQRRSD